jgi:uncharacterized membrane protein
MSENEKFLTNEKGRGVVIKSVYICYLISLFLGGIPLFVGFFINLFMRDGANQIELSHFRSQLAIMIRVLIWTVIGILTTPILIGFAILFIVFIWFIVKCIRGLDLASRGLPINEYY